MKQVGNTQELNEELLQDHNRQQAIQIVQRLRAFKKKWFEDPARKHGRHVEAKRAARLLDAIGGKLIIIPAANDLSAKTKSYTYLITLSSALNWQNLQLFETSEAFFAKLDMHFDMLEDAVKSYPDPPCVEKYEDYIDTSDVDQKAKGLLCHAWQLGIAIKTRSQGKCLVPLAFSPLAAKSLAAVIANKTREDWVKAESYSAFWTCTTEQYRAAKAGDLESLMERLGEITGNDNPAEVLGAILDWNTSVTVFQDDKEKAKINLACRQNGIQAAIPNWFTNETLGEVSYGDDAIEIIRHNLPDGTIFSAKEKMLEKFISHWLTDGLGAKIISTKKDEKSFFQSVRLDLKQGPGPVIYYVSRDDKRNDVNKLKPIKSLRNMEKRGPSSK